MTKVNPAWTNEGDHRQHASNDGAAQCGEPNVAVRKKCEKSVNADVVDNMAAREAATTDSGLSDSDIRMVRARPAHHEFDRSGNGTGAPAEQLKHRFQPASLEP